MLIIYIIGISCAKEKKLKSKTVIKIVERKMYVEQIDFNFHRLTN
jgi:hypothetical protein